MQFYKNTRVSSKRNYLIILVKVTLLFLGMLAIVTLLNKIDFPSPNKKIEKVIPNENFKIVK